MFRKKKNLRMRLLFLLAVLQCCTAYKMVIFTPDISKSQVMFNKRVAETLADAGHDVTMAMITSFDDVDNSAVKINANVKVYRVNASTGVSEKELHRTHSEVIFEDIPPWDKRQRVMMELFLGVLTESCRHTIRNKEFMHWLENEKFDIAFAHMYTTCPIGLIHAARIPTWVWLNSGMLMDFVADIVGVPTIPSYVPPGLMESHDRLDFFQRLKSLIGHGLLKVMWPKLVPNKETAIFREELDPSFPDIVDLARECPLVMVNSNQLYELPRPTIAKVVNIGGIGAQLKNAKPLPENFEKLVSSGEGVVIMSFGSVAAAHHMPAAWKKAFLAAFQRFPKHQFLLRYEADDLEGSLPANVHTFKWLPQTDLLQHPKTRAFITHGGYNSMQEAISAGKPLITIALFGDQPKNAKIAEKHGMAVNLVKSEITEETVYEAVKEVLEKKSYTEEAILLREMVRNQPIAPDHLLVRWSEFLAKFQRLDNLVPAGQKLNFFQYHSIDVIAFLATISFSVLFIVFKLVKFLFSMICCRNSCKKQKTA